MTFTTWIEKVGPRPLAKKLKVDPSTISSWKNRHTFPRRDKIKKIYKISKGQINAKVLMAHYFN